MSFADVRHQDGALATLRAAVAADRLPQAYLFVGPPGVGKGLVARQLAKLLFCASPVEPATAATDSCGVCTHCVRVDHGTHPDLYWFRKEPDRNDFRIELVTRRDGSPANVVTESVTLQPMEAERTVTVIDDAERMNANAANSLLKSLEEPAPHAVLILVCSEVANLPGTILSRCQWVRFRPLPEAFVADRLSEILRREATAAAEDPRADPPRSVSPDEAAYVCRLAGGSIETADRLAGSGLWDLKRELVARLPEMDEAVGIDMAGAVDAWARARAKAERTTRESREETALRRQAVRTALAAVGSALRDAAVVACGGDVALANVDQAAEIGRLADWGPEALERAVAIQADAQGHISRYVHIELATENALVQISRLRPVRAGR